MVTQPADELLRGHAQDYLGPLLIGSCINLVLYGISVCWQWQYWHLFKSDTWTLRASVAVQAISDASGTLAIFLMVYQYAVPNYGIPASLEIQDWHWSVLAITTGITAGITHCFLITRMHRLSGKWRLTTPLIFLSVVALACAVWVTFEISKPSITNARQYLKAGLCTWVGATMLVNASLCSSIVYFLFDLSRLQYINTRHILKRLMVVALVTGLVLLGVEIGGLVTYLKFPNTNISASMLFIIGRLYTLTLLINLNLRHAEAPEVSRVGRFIQSPADKPPPISIMSLQYPALSRIRTADVVRRESADTLVSIQKPAMLPHKDSLVGSLV